MLSPNAPLPMAVGHVRWPQRGEGSFIVGSWTFKYSSRNLFQVF